MKKRLLPCLAVLFLLLTACGVGHMGVHALEDILRVVRGWGGGVPGNEARTVHVTYAEQECGDYRVVLVLPDDTVVELEEGRTRWRCRRGAPGWPWPPPGAVGPSPPNGNHKYPKKPPAA